jgi:hypothetical protein
MAKAKTIENEGSVPAFLSGIPDAARQKDAFAIMEIFQSQSGFPARMWGPAIVGFGSYHYKYESGHEGDAPLVAFSPRKNAFVLYLSSVFDRREELLEKFGKHKRSKACIYFNKLSDIDESVFREMITQSMNSVLQKCG